MSDPLNVAHWPVHVTPVTGAALTKLRARLDVLEREAQHLRTAAQDMLNGLTRNDSRLLTNGVMNGRNWALSVVVSQCYVQNILGKDAPGSSGFPGQLSPWPYIQSTTLYGRAAKLGAEMGVRDQKM
jgi:hypothetical protein